MEKKVRYEMTIPWWQKVEVEEQNENVHGHLSGF